MNRKFWQNAISLALMFGMLLPMHALAAEEEQSAKTEVTFTKSRNFDANTNGLSEEGEEEYKLANKAYKNRDSEQVIQHTTRLIELDPDSPKGYALRAAEYILQKESEKAIEDLKKAIELDPDKASYNLEVGILYLNGREWLKALPYFEKTLALDPKNTAAMVNSASLYNQLSLGDKSVKYADMLLKTDKNFIVGNKLRGIGYYHLRKYKEAYDDLKFYADELEKGLKGKGLYGVGNEKANSASAYYYLADTCAKMDNKEEAIKYYSKSIEIDPARVASYIGRSVAYDLSSKERDVALLVLEDLNKAIELAPIDPYVIITCYEHRADVNYRLGNYEESIKNYEDFLKVLPILEEKNKEYCLKSRVRTYNQLAYSYMDLKRYDEALKCAQESVKLSSSYINQDTLGEVLEAMGRHEEAEKCYLESIRLSPSQKEVDMTIPHLERNRKAMASKKVD